MQLVIGNYNLSSWSLRPWLVLRRSGLPFETIRLPFHLPDWRRRLAAWASHGKVPVLVDGPVRVWDSLAIAEYVAERALPVVALWPRDPPARAAARSIAAEMHSGFAHLRAQLPMNVAARLPAPALRAETREEIERIVALWREARTGWGGDGPFLFGDFSIADAFYAPVVSRFVTYGIELPADLQPWADAILSMPEMREWAAAARREAAEEPPGGPPPRV